MTWRVGMKALCVNASEWEGWSVIKEGGIYTVAQIVEWKGKPAFHFSDLPSFLGVPYFACRFRPLIERKTNIGFAHEILRKTSRKHGVEA